MPTYEYVCDAGHETDHRQSIDDDPEEVCPRDGCGAPARRKISLGAGVMVGGGGAPEPASGGPSGGGCCGPGGCACRN